MNFRSVVLQEELCKGCTLCVKRCPTEAIRVRRGKAHIIWDRCIDCGECIRICPEHAKLAIVDSLDMMAGFKYTIALPAPSLYGQFSDLKNAAIILKALLEIGFDEVFEVAAAAEKIAGYISGYLSRDDVPRPVINSACPAIVRMITLKFPSLTPHVLPFYSPMEYAAEWARGLAVAKTGLKPEEIGIFFISPCPAKVRAVHLSITGSSNVDAAISIKDIYPRLRQKYAELKKLTDEPVFDSIAGASGIGWCSAGGEAANVDNPNFVAADGIDNVIRLLEDIEDGRLPEEVQFVELDACSGGCVGGVLTVESPFVARSRIASIIRESRMNDKAREPLKGEPESHEWGVTLNPDITAMRLDSDIATAMKMMRELNRIEKSLYGMDCGACGAPNCRALAEDIVRGYATEDLCIYIIKEKLQKLLDEQNRLLGKESLSCGENY